MMNPLTTAEIRHFKRAERDVALEWLKQAS